MPLPDLYSYDSYRQYLAAWFEAKRSQHRHYTHRRFAVEAGQTNVGILALLTSGRRHLTPHLIQGIRKPLDLDDAQTEFLSLLAQKEEVERELSSETRRHERALERIRPTDPREGPPSADQRRREKTAANALAGAEAARAECEARLRQVREQIASRQALHLAELLRDQRMRILSDWTTAALRELARCAGFTADVDWTARAFGGRASPERLAQSLALLRELNAIPASPGPGPEARSLITLLEVPKGDVRTYFEGIYEQAGLAMPRHFDDRAFQDRSRLGALTVAVPSSAVPRLQSLMREIQEQIFAFFEGLQEEPDVVYQLYLHLFPLTEPTGRDP